MWIPSKIILSGHIAMLCFSILVSVSFVAGARIANQIEPNAVTFSRFLIAVLFIAIIVTAQNKWKYAKLLSDPRSIVLGLLIAIYFITMFEGLKTAGSISMSAVLKTSNGLSVIEHNHQIINEDGLTSETEEGTTNLKQYGFQFRAFDKRGGGLLTGFIGGEQ